jgi:hypothetical protein
VTRDTLLAIVLGVLLSLALIEWGMEEPIYQPVYQE